LTFPN